MISTPLSSSPWMAAQTNNVGPSRRPWMTCTGMVRAVCELRRGISRPTSARLPGLIRWSAISKAARIASALALAARAGEAALVALLGESLLDEPDLHVGNILARSCFDPFQARRGIDFHDHRTVVGTQQIHTGDIQSHGLGGAHGSGAFFGCDANQAGRSTAMQIRAEFACLALTLHRGDYLAVDDETADVGAVGLANIFLHQDVGFHPHESLDHADGGGLGFGQHHANALRTFEQLDHQWGAADHLDQILDVVWPVSETGHRQADALA